MVRVIARTAAASVARVQPTRGFSRTVPALFSDAEVPEVSTASLKPRG